MAAMHMNGLEARREWVSFEADNDYEISLLPEAQRILDTGPVFEGIFAFNDRLARVLPAFTPAWNGTRRDVDRLVR